MIPDTAGHAASVATSCDTQEGAGCPRQLTLNPIPHGPLVRPMPDGVLRFPVEEVLRPLPDGFPVEAGRAIRTSAQELVPVRTSTLFFLGFALNRAALGASWCSVRSSCRIRASWATLSQFIRGPMEARQARTRVHYRFVPRRAVSALRWLTVQFP